MKSFILVVLPLITLLQAGELNQRLKNRSVGTKEVITSIEVRIIIPARKLANTNTDTDSATINNKQEINNKSIRQTDN